MPHQPDQPDQPPPAFPPRPPNPVGDRFSEDRRRIVCVPSIGVRGRRRASLDRAVRGPLASPAGRRAAPSPARVARPGLRASKLTGPIIPQYDGWRILARKGA